jgi:hypothetical protein
VPTSLLGLRPEDFVLRTSSWGLGFTGGCYVPIIDANENVLGPKWLIWPLGVDARSIWWKRSRRTDHLENQIDLALAAQATRIELWFSHMPKDRWDAIMAEASGKLGALKKLYDQIMMTM